MNVEIDITDYKKLMRAKATLLRWLKIVDFAIVQYHGPPSFDESRDKPEPKGVQPRLAFMPEGVSTSAEIDAQINRLLEGLKKKFTTTDLILGLGDKGKENRPRVKLALKPAEA